MRTIRSQAAPDWALPLWWEDPADIRFYQVDDRTAFTIRTDRPLMSQCDHLYIRFFVDETFVAAAKVLGPGNSDLSTANVLCFVEVHPEHRGHRYSSRLMELVQGVIGPVYRSGMVSQSGHANMKHLDLPLVPGREVRITETVDYRFIDWTTGHFISPSGA